MKPATLQPIHLAIRPVNRRRLLKGIGVGLALPMLECMSPVFGKNGNEESPRRMLLMSNNLGLLPDPFFPTTSGPEYAASPYLKELDGYRKDFTVFSGLSHPAVSGGHSTENCFLTGAKDPTGSGFRNTISLDQFVVEQMGQKTRFPTLNLGVNIDRANRSLSWTRDGVLLPAEDRPSAVFRKMFLQGNQREIELRLARLKEQGSILDVLREDLTGFSGHLGARDRDRMDQYLTSIRDLESRLQAAGEWERKPRPTTDLEPPKDIEDKAQFFPKLDLMLSMATLALESDSTRVVNVMIDGFATPVFNIGPKETSLTGYHNLSHHGQSRQKLEQLRKVDHQQMGVLKRLLDALSVQEENGGRLLDSTMVLFGSNLGDANVHNNTNLPILLAGGGFQHGRHLAFDKDNNTPLCNLFVSMLRQMQIETEHFGSSTGPLRGLDSKA